MNLRAKVKENAPSQWRIPPLCSTDNKYTRGHVIILGGAVMTGAARLAALAAARAGAGLVTIATTRDTWPIYATSLLGVIVRPCDAKAWAALIADDHAHVVLIGPGAGVNTRTKRAILAAVKAKKPLVLDADAVTLLAEDAALRKALVNVPKILTPHEGEYARLAKAFKLSMTLCKDELAVQLAMKLNAVILLKGARTLISDGTRVLVTHPPAWLATAGTGDVLAGMIAALVGQGMDCFDAAAAGAWVHAQAAQLHGRGMIAEDVIGSVAEVLRGLE